MPESIRGAPWRRLDRGRALLGALLAAAAIGMPAAAQEPGLTEAALYRVFLRDGAVLVSYGEFARVGDRVVLSLPIGGTDAAPALHVLTIAEGEVDWDRTNAYVEAARARHYADTRGEADFSRLTREVADILYQAGLAEDATKRLALAEAARQRLIDWPRQHYAYKADELAQMTSWLDQVVSELRVAAGLSRFDLTLVARGSSASPPVQLLPPPDLRERTELAFVAAAKTPDANERVSLLEAVQGALEPRRAQDEWAAAAYARASAQLAAEHAVARAYADLTRRTLTRAAYHAERADVRNLERLVQSVLAEDAKLQRARPAEMSALLGTLDARIDAARRLRLARDAWQLRAGLVRAYWRDIRQGLDRLLGVRLWLTDVRQLAGPSPDALKRLAYDAQVAGHEFAKVTPPAEVSGAHSTLAAAGQMAVRAATTRLDALRSGSMTGAWEASSAAAGALLLLDQAVQELRRITREPEPRLSVR